MAAIRLSGGIVKPEIATILDDGTYGQREMTDEEYAEWQAVAANNPPQNEPEEETPTE